MTLTLVDGRFHLSCPFYMKGKAGAVPGAKWRKKLNAWTYPATPLVYEALVKTFDVRIADVESSSRTIERSKYEPKTLLYKHQEEAVQFLLRQFNIEVEDE